MAGTIAHAFAIDEAGNPVALQDHQVPHAANAGLQSVSPQQASELTQRGKDADYVDQNYGTAGKAALGGLNGITMGLGPAALTHLGLLDRGHLEAAEQSGAFGAGDIAGMLAPALLTGGASAEAEGALGVVGKALRFGTPAGLMGEAGSAASRLVGRLLPEAGLMGKAVSPALRMAAQGASEGALISVAHQASQDIIQNKPLAAQSLLASGMHGGLFGGLVGGVLGGAAGLAGAGIDAVGGGAARLGSLETKELAGARALKHLGAGSEDLAAFKAAEGGIPGAVKDFHDIMSEGGSSYAAKAGHIHEVAKASKVKLGAIADDVVSKLQQEAPNGIPQASRVGARIEHDVTAIHGDGIDAIKAQTLVRNLRKEMEGIQTFKKVPADPAAYGSPGAHGAEVPETIGGLKDWKAWTDSREALADRMKNATGLKKEVYKTALNAFDGELKTAMETANPELAAQFAAAKTQKRIASELADMTAKKHSEDIGRPAAHKLNGADGATFGYSIFAGANPVVGAGIIAGKKLVAHAQQALEGPIAEYSARTAMGAHAGGAVVNIGQRMTDGLRTFMTSGRQAAIKHVADAKPSYTMANYKAQMQLADDLTSEAHMAKVREMTQAMATSGHPELAHEMAETYGRAVAYVRHNQPKRGSKEVKAGRLGKPLVPYSPDTGGMRFLRQMHAIQNPMSIIDGLVSGDVSRDAVAAVKYVFPDIHKDLVYRASQEIMTMKESGKYLPADKVAMLGTVLDAPIDSSLEKDFIDNVQQGLAANNAPQPEKGDAPPPQTDTSSYQTPLQSSVST